MKDWIKKSLSEKDGSPSIKRQGLAFSLLVCAGIAIASFISGKDVSTNLNTLLQTLLAASGASYTFGRFAEAKEVTNNG